MSSFKLEKGGSAKQQAVQGGVFLAIMGIIVIIFVMVQAGVVMMLLGVAIALGGRFASS